MNEKENALLIALESDDAPAVLRLLCQGVNVEFAKPPTGVRALHVAAQRDALACALLLLNNGADVNAADGDGWTPLHYAASSSHLRMIVLLLKAKADPAKQSGSGQTAAKMAATVLCADAMALLRTAEEYSADPSSVKAEMHSLFRAHEVKPGLKKE